MGLRCTVRAAGGVVWRLGRDGIEVLLIHRPRYRDWSFPKGKVKERWAPVEEVAHELTWARDCEVLSSLPLEALR